MKKRLVCLIAVTVICLCGCTQKIEYKTKYIDNCASTEFRQELSNASTVLRNLEYGEIVSYQKDEENGYSKVVYNGVTGYVLSTTLSEQKPTEKNTGLTEYIIVESTDFNNKHDYLISDLGGEYIEKYISNYIRPLYNQINNNINMYSRKKSGSITTWYDNKRLCKKELPQGAENYNMSRQYYYDTSSGELLFAFIFKGTQEHRLYFKDNKLVRYIDAVGNIINNPVTVDSLKMADHAIQEAY